MSQPNPNPTDLVRGDLVTVMAEAAQQAALTAIDEMVNDQCDDICARRKARTIDLDMFLASMTSINQARKRVRATIVPQKLDGNFTGGRKP